MEFEKFLVDDLHRSSVNDFDLLIENLFSRITIVTKFHIPKSSISHYWTGSLKKKKKHILRSSRN